MDPQRFERVRELLLRVTEVPEEERPAVLERECRDDVGLRREVEELLAQDERATGLLDVMTGRRSATRLAPAAPTQAAHPERIGPYRILGVLGEGGMGTVYEAEQESPRRRVAVKVVRGGAFVDEARARLFRREAETLARLKHPGIGAIYESGRTPDGQHYFAMELVRGDTLDGWLARRGPVITREEVHFRMALFARIADAVQYAHQRGVIHRDLKPSNIVVTEEAMSLATDTSFRGSRLPGIKILDFGLARITEGDVTVTTMVSEVGVIKGTLPYMSPEQARGDPDAIDVRTDVYALGVILYEMLAGRRPYDVMKRSLAEAVRVICEEAPSSLRQSMAGMRRLDADVETIAGKALEKDPDRRYASAAAMAEDVARYLASQPILARPPSAMYQLRTFAKRNRVLVGGVAAVFVVLLAASIMATTLYLRAEQARAVAAEERDAAQAVTEHFTSTLSAVAPVNAQGREVTVREVMDRSAAVVDSAFAGQPVVEASVRYTIGETYLALSRFDEAERHLTAALELRRREYGEDHPETLNVMSKLAWLHFNQGRLEEAEALYLRTLEGRRRVLGEEHEDTLWSIHDLSCTYRDLGKDGEAERLVRELRPVAERVLGPDDDLTLWCQYHHAVVLDKLGRWEEAEALHQKTLEQRRRLLGEKHPSTLWSMVLLSYTQENLGKLDEAEARVRRALEIDREVLGPDHFDTLFAENILGEILYRQRRLPEAEATLTRVRERRLELLGEQSRDTLWTECFLAYVWAREGRLEESEALLRHTLEIRARRLGETHWDTLWSKESLAWLLLRENKTEEAEELAREALAARREDREVSGHYYRDALNQLGTILVARGKPAEAEPLLLEAARLLEQNPVQHGWNDDDIVPSLVELYETWARVDPAGGHEKAAGEWRARLP